ncbi:hypothetical protein RHOSPDRAFT_35020 [Rhodotorula sp. JG-1b]|nr:hypothetical protein RHOSPDRAFT_35020 [Rhodotorula sp. JG-1b]
MSLLTDRDLLLLQFQLAYIRHVLPNHAPLHAASNGGGAATVNPYNLISFPAPDQLRSQSPYLAASESTSPEKYPELLANSRGRRSPPIALQIARRGGMLGESGSNSSGTVTPTTAAVGGGDEPSLHRDRRRRRTTGPGPLGYTQTIVGRNPTAGGYSTSLGGAGMRVDGGKPAAWTGKGVLGSSATQQGNDNVAGMQLPPVVVHSPIKTPHGGGITTTTDSAPLPVLRHDGPEFLRSPPEAGALVTPPTTTTTTTAPPPAPVAKPPPVDEDPARSRQQDLHRISRDTFSSSSYSSSPAGTETGIGAPHDSSSTISTPYGTGIGAAGGRANPLVSSVSDSSPDFLDGPARRDPDSLPAPRTSTVPSHNDRAAPSTGSDETPPATAAVLAPAPAPVFQLPPGLRVRERRRVNIRGGIPGLVAPQAPTSAAGVPPSLPPSPAIAHPQQDASVQPGRERDASTTGSERDQEKRDQLSVPAPPVPPVRPGPSSRRSSRSSSINDDDWSPSLSSTGPKTPRQLFPPRAEYITASLNRRHGGGGGGGGEVRAASKSGLSLLLGPGTTAGGGSASARRMNPFSTLYAACVSRASDAVRLSLYFPHAASHKVQVGVKQDVTVEEVIGVGLWAYWEDENLEPKLEVDEREAQEGRETVKWNLRIVEDDGEVDEDFPALDRLRQLSAFSFHEFAIVKATPQQIEDNATKQATITRRPSRILVNAPPALPSASTSGLTGGGAGPPPHANAAAAGHPAGSALAIPINLVIRAPIVDSAPQIELQVSSDMYIVDVIELVLQRLSLASSETAHDFVLVVRLADGDMVVPPDRTVESLGEQHVLELVPRSDVGPAGLRRFRTRDEQPDAAGIVTRPEHARETSRIPIADLAGLYERFTVLRKVPLSLGGRHARVIAIDGDYLHFMPPDGMSGRTTSFHVSKLRACSVSRRSANSFKIVVNTKRYDFETESPERAREIVERIRQAVEAWRVEHKNPLLVPTGFPNQSARLRR